MDNRGLYGKYRIEKADGSPVDPNAVYFTLRLDSDPHARAAIRAYIESCRGEQPELAKDLEVMLKKIEKKLYNFGAGNQEILKKISTEG
jgi:hypothetical protein